MARNRADVDAQWGVQMSRLRELRAAAAQTEKARAARR